MHELTAVIDFGHGRPQKVDFIGGFNSFHEAAAAAAMYLYHFYGVCHFDDVDVFDAIQRKVLIAVDDETSVEFLIKEAKDGI